MNAALWVLLTATCLSSATSHLAPQAPRPEESKPKKSASLIDINRATAEDFATLPGIGPELARRIVEFRAKHGPFKRVEDLLVIKGMGRKKWRAIRPYLTIGEEPKKS